MIATNENYIPAVAYYRMSTDRQETSIPDQRTAVEKYAKANGYHIVREYIDEGISGDATDKRREFQAMVRDGQHRKFQAILCWDIDRFGRFDSLEAGYWIFPLRRAGVHLATVAQGFIDWGDFAGRVLYGIQQEAKNQYLTDLSRNVTRGMTSLAEQGLWASGKPALGYVAVNKRLLLGPTEDVALVRWLFTEYLAAKSLRGLADELNNSGRPSPKGKGWTANGIAGMLRNRVYVGDYIWNMRCMSKYKRKGRPEQRNNAADWIVFEDHHEAIIDRDTFDRVQQQLAERRNCSTPHPSGGGFVLSGVLRCGKCGHKMIGDLSNGKHHYTCYGYRQHGKTYCDRNTLRQNEIVAGVLDGLQERYYNPETLAQLASSMRRQLKELKREPEPQALRRELDAIEAKLAKAKQRLVEVDADLLDDVQEQIRGLRRQRVAAEARLASCASNSRTKGDDIDRRVEAALEWFGRFREAATKADPHLLRQFFRGSISRVDIFTDKRPWGKRSKYRLERGIVWMRNQEPVTNAPEILAM